MAALPGAPAMLIADEVTTMVDQQGRDALLAVPGRPDSQRHWTALCTSRTTTTKLIPLTARSAWSDSPDNTDMVHTAAMPAPVIGVII